MYLTPQVWSELRSAKRKRRGGSLGGLERKAAAVIALMEFQTQLRGRLLQHK